MRRRIRWGPVLVNAWVVFAAFAWSAENSISAESHSFPWSWVADDAARESSFLQDPAGVKIARMKLQELVRDARDLSFLDPVASPHFSLANRPPRAGRGSARALRYEYTGGHPRILLAEGGELAFGPEIFPRARETEMQRLAALGAWNEALAGDPASLEQSFQRTVQTMDFSTERGGYNFYWKRGRFLRSSSRETLESESETRFLHVSRSESGKDKRAADRWEGGECVATGIVLYTDASRSTVLDRVLESRCSVHDENALKGEAELLTASAARLAGGRLAFVGVRLSENSPFRIDLMVRLHGDALGRLFQLSEAQFVDLLGRKRCSGLEAELVKELREFFATPDESAKMDLLTGWLTSSQAMRFALLRLLDEAELEARIADQEWRSPGKTVEASPALAALRAWSALAGRNLLGGL